MEPRFPNPGLLHCGQILFHLSHREAQGYWSGYPIPFTEHLLDPGIQPGYPACRRVFFLPTELSSQLNSPSMRKRSGLWREYSPPLPLPEHLIWCSGNWLNKIAYYSSLKHSVLSLFKNFTAHLLLPLLLKTGKNKTLSYFDYVVLKYGADLMKWPEEISSHFLLTDLWKQWCLEKSAFLNSLLCLFMFPLREVNLMCRNKRLLPVV